LTQSGCDLFDLLGQRRTPHIRFTVYRFTVWSTANLQHLDISRRCRFAVDSRQIRGESHQLRQFTTNLRQIECLRRIVYTANLPQIEACGKSVTNPRRVKGKTTTNLRQIACVESDFNLSNNNNNKVYSDRSIQVDYTVRQYWSIGSDQFRSNHSEYAENVIIEAHFCTKPVRSGC